MRPELWDAYATVCSIGEEDGTPPKENPADDARRRAFVEVFKRHLPPAPDGATHVLAPGALAEALILAEAGYTVHAVQLPGANIRWLRARGQDLPEPDRLEVFERDAHDLWGFKPATFDGYFSCQFQEHLIAPFVHLGEVRYCSKVGAIAFVDACGTTNPAMRTIHHVNLTNEAGVALQWDTLGWKEIARGPWGEGEMGGDSRPQFVFQMLAADDPEFRHRADIAEIMRRRGEIQ